MPRPPTHPLTHPPTHPPRSLRPPRTPRHPRHLRPPRRGHHRRDGPHPSRLAGRPPRRPLSFNAFFALPNRPQGNDNTVRRWPFSSSFELGPAFFSPDAGTNAIARGSTHAQYNFSPGITLGNRRLSEIRFPSQKAMLRDQYSRHFGPRIAFFPYTEARIPVLFADGGAVVHTTGDPLIDRPDTNPGFQPRHPASLQPTTFFYQPNPAWEPPVLQGEGAGLLVRGFYRYTRSGLRARDFSGPEVPWVP